MFLCSPTSGPEGVCNPWVLVGFQGACRLRWLSGLQAWCPGGWVRSSLASPGGFGFSSELQKKVLWRSGTKQEGAGLVGAHLAPRARLTKGGIPCPLEAQGLADLWIPSWCRGPKQLHPSHSHGTQEAREGAEGTPGMR